MSEGKNYVQPPHEGGFNPISKLKEIYANLHPDYWKRKLPHLLLVIPVVWFIDSLILFAMFPYQGGAMGLLLMLLSLGLPIVSAIFYPYSLYWYNDSFIGRMLNNMFHLGGFWTVVLRIIMTAIGGILIAGIFSPLMGVLTWKKYKKKNLIIGEEKDFL
ncbi:hypothetical protein ACWN8V_01280 [Vagococcus elongatus]|uniref:Uncharacterized protein n=1 Tax=Vagococcus elongatus TaxID=180344 RepID=A0A430B5Z5_9ENTE|nr:hypothetical protein [Vagococcus elongatus]RSU15729.1 hypothetical protein CBF29_01260 [Vagococcus elongatus]